MNRRLLNETTLLIQNKCQNNEMHASRRTRADSVVNHARRLRDFWRYHEKMRIPR